MVSHHKTFPNKIAQETKSVVKAFHFLDIVTIFITFYEVTWPKFGQIYNVQYINFHLTPSLPTFMKIDITYEIRMQKPKSIK